MPDAIPAICPHCDKAMRLPADAVGRKVKCGGCSTILRIHAEGEALRLLPLEPAAALPPASASSPCASCGGAVVAEDTFCNHCGANLSAAAEQEQRVSENRNLSEQRRGRRGHMHRHNKILSASRILVALCLLFLVAGTWQGVVTKRTADQAREELSIMRADEVLDLDDATMTVAELRRSIDLEVAVAFGVHYMLAAIMLALFFWARRSPFPAMLTGLCVYLVVVVLNGIVEPQTLAQGIIIKILIISGLVGGLRAALAQRAAMRRDGIGERPRRRARSA